MKINQRVDFKWNGNEVKVRGKKVVGKSVFQTGLIVEGQAKLLSPVKTGRLAGSITVQTRDDGTDIVSLARSVDKIRQPIGENVAHVGTAVFYGPYVEFGTVRSGAQPFLRPSLDLAKGLTLSILRRNGRAIFGNYLK